PPLAKLHYAFVHDARAQVFTIFRLLQTTTFWEWTNSRQAPYYEHRFMSLRRFSYVTFAYRFFRGSGEGEQLARS
ncbi:MAG TPA: hypothetical protein VMU24_13970, partial [Candidatus Acidoferrales bacterium]|nr:hypothetical protein [Candidatus Acidoferrales bacterium]